MVLPDFGRVKSRTGRPRDKVGTLYAEFGRWYITRRSCYTDFVSFQRALRSMKNVTITLDEETAAWARIYAAEHNTSVSRIVGEMLQRQMREGQKYAEAMRRFLAKKPVRLKRAGKRYATRDELHDRARLR